MMKKKSKRYKKILIQKIKNKKYDNKEILELVKKIQQQSLMSQ